MKVKVMMATALAALVMLSGCGSTPAASSEVETYSSAMQLVTLTDDEMLTSIQEAAKELQKNINKTDETAKVDVEVDKNGKCIVYASGRDENGNATTRQELCKADTIKDKPFGVGVIPDTEPCKITCLHAAQGGNATIGCGRKW